MNAYELIAAYSKAKEKQLAYQNQSKKYSTL